MTRAQLNEKLAALTAERDAFVQEANQRIAFLNGQIMAYEAMAADMERAGAPVEADSDEA